MLFYGMLKCVLMHLNFKNMSFETLEQKLLDEFHQVIYKKLCELKIDYVQHGEQYVLGESEFKGKKITIKISIK